MRSKAKTLLTLPQFADSGLLDKWHLGGFCVYDDSCKCERELYPEHAWQGKRVSRQEISNAISQAETLIAYQLAYWPAPKAITAEVHDYPVSDGAPGMLTVNRRAFKSIKPLWDNVLKIGTYVETLLDDAAVVTLGAGNDRYSISITLPSQPEAGDEYAVYFTEADRRNEPLDEWEIRGFNTSVALVGSDYILTITGDAYWLLASSFRFMRKAECADPDDADSFVTTVEVYRRVFDTSLQATLIWHKRGCDGNECIEERRAACVELDGSPRYPMFRVKPATWNAGSGEWDMYPVHYPPAKVEFNYVSGAPLVAGLMDRSLATAVFNLAASLLEATAPYCECDKRGGDRLTVLREYERTQVATRDAIQTIVEFNDRVMATKEQLNNTWGGRLGAIRAWQIIQAIERL